MLVCAKFCNVLAYKNKYSNMSSLSLRLCTIIILYFIYRVSTNSFAKICKLKLIFPYNKVNIMLQVLISILGKNTLFRSDIKGFLSSKMKKSKFSFEDDPVFIYIYHYISQDPYQSIQPWNTHTGSLTHRLTHTQTDKKDTIIFLWKKWSVNGSLDVQGA